MSGNEPTVIRVPKPLDFIPVRDFPEGHRHYGKLRCQAWSNNNGRQCLGIASYGTDKCRVHGGKSPKGMASPSWKNGKYSKYLPKRLQSRYEEGLSDTELLSLREEASLIRVRLTMLLDKLDEVGDSREAWFKVQDAYRRFLDANKKGDAEKASAALREMGAYIKTGVDEQFLWGEIFTTTTVLKSLVESEQKRQVAMEQLITVEQAWALFRSITLAVKTHVNDPIVLAEIQADFSRFAEIANISVAQPE